MSSAAQEAIKTFFVTLRRSPIGTPWFHKRILASLGLQRRHDCVERPNNAMIRGQLKKVAHLVRIETDQMFYNRKLTEAETASLKPPIRVQHAPAGWAASQAQASSSSSSSGGSSSSRASIGGGCASSSLGNN